ncbi:MAG: HEPN domain-containing protein [Spirochaetes bacterium]|nr:HEPN domain-containing protein [Spirochaetota bacterium]
MAQNRAMDWFKQAKDDLCWAEDSFKARHYAQTCFIAQQVGEKALKAVALSRGYMQVKSHSILEIARALEADGEIQQIARRLDQYYIGTRYPDAFPAGAPFEFYTKDQAAEALAFANRLVELTEKMLSP